MEQSKYAEIGNLNVDSFIWSQAEIGPPQKKKDSFQIYTVSKSIKNATILDHLKPDYGSLGEFMKDVGISKDILLHNRKKKNDQQDDLQQKKIRVGLKDKNLEKVLKQENVSQVQKTIASKMIVQNLFEKNFGINLHVFCSQNSKLENQKSSYSGVQVLGDMLEQIIKKPSEEQFMQLNEINKHDLPILTRAKNMLSLKEIVVAGSKQKNIKILQIKQRYASLKRTAISEQVLNMDQFQNQQNQKQQSQNQQNQKQQNKQSKDSVRQSTNKGSAFQLSSSIVTLNTLVKQLKSVSLQSVTVIKLVGISITDDLFCFMLDFFIGMHVQLNELVVENVRFVNTEKVSLKIKQLVQQTKISKLILHGIGLKSKDFCLICLGVGSKSFFSGFSVCDNEITEVAVRCLDVLMKFNKQIKFNLTGNPIQRQIKNKANYQRCFATIN